MAGLALIAHFSPLEAVALVREFGLDALSEKIEAQHSIWRHASTRRGINRTLLIEDEYRLAQQISERAWVEKLIGEIKDGTLNQKPQATSSDGRSPVSKTSLSSIFRMVAKRSETRYESEKGICMNRAGKKALIIGCGIAGPVVAFFLQRAGIEAEIYEARASSTDYGGGFLNMACNGFSVLKTLGLDDLVSCQGSPIPRMMIWSGKASVLARSAMEQGRKGEPQSINILRSRLHLVLREEVERKGIKMAFGEKLVGLSTREQGVIATFEDGTTAEGAFLVGCDGVNSHTRQLINPEAPTPQYTGLISTGGFVQHSSFPPTPDMMHFYSASWPSSVITSALLESCTGLSISHKKKRPQGKCQHDRKR